MKAGNYSKYINVFSRSLGWGKLKKMSHLTSAGAEDGSDELVVWYETGDLDDLYFMVQHEGYYARATVYAVRYRLCSGGHAFRIQENLDDLNVEANRVATFLHKDWFTTRKRRNEYRDMHPECSKLSWSKLRRDGLPYRCSFPQQ